MWTKKTKAALAGASILALTACGSAPRSPTTAGDSTIPVTTTPRTSTSSIPVTTTTTSSATGYGVVQAIDVVPREQAGIGIGAVAGAVVSGVLGNQVGSGSGRKAATVAGSPGGAPAGHQMQEDTRRADKAYRV